MTQTRSPSVTGDGEAMFLLVADAVSAPHRLLPANGSGLAVERDQIEPVARVVAPAEQPRVRPVQVGAFFRRSDEDGIAPDDRRRPPPQLGKAVRQITFPSRSSEPEGRSHRSCRCMGATPLRPVVARRGRRGRDCERRENERQPLHKGYGIRRNVRRSGRGAQPCPATVTGSSPTSTAARPAPPRLRLILRSDRGDQSANASIKSPVACNRASFALANA